MAIASTKFPSRAFRMPCRSRTPGAFGSRSTSGSSASCASAKRSCATNESASVIGSPARASAHAIAASTPHAIAVRLSHAFAGTFGSASAVLSTTATFSLPVPLYDKRQPHRSPSYAEGRAEDRLMTEQILILDFGSQVTQLIARRVREAGVYCEIRPFTTPAAEIERLAPQGVILSGGPASVHGGRGTAS